MRQRAFAAFAGAAALAAAAAQSPPGDAAASAANGGGPTPPTLQAAWLREVLDLDIGGAVATYRVIAADDQSPEPDRLIAIARLLELRRLGVAAATSAPPPDASLLPTVVRPLLDPADDGAGPPPLLQQELAAGAGDPASLRAFIAGHDLPPLRPLVFPTVLAAAEQADPVRLERLRRLRARYGPWSSDPTRVLDRVRANEIVRLELDDRGADAEALRQRMFPNWKPQPWPEDHAAAWSAALASLDAWLRERQLTAAEQSLLQRLRARLVAAAADDPVGALRLLDRMPLFAERLRADGGR